MLDGNQPEESADDIEDGEFHDATSDQELQDEIDDYLSSIEQTATIEPRVTRAAARQRK